MVELRNRIESHAARVAVMGQGYVGLPLAIEFAKAGFSVTGIDLDADKVAALNRGASHIPDVPTETVRELVASKRYRAATAMDALGESDAIIICVPTPLRKAKDPDISFVLSATTEVKKRLRAGQLVVLESTTYPGTTEEMLLPMLEESGLKVGRDFFLAFSPERIDPGNEQFKVKDIPKVVGGITPECTRMTAALYEQIVSRVLQVSSPTVAELAKLYENTFRSVNIALANEFALMCRYLGSSVWEVIEAAATKPFGFMPFSPGPGIGGHCIPIDPIYLSWKLRLNGYEARFIALADEINRGMPHQVIALLMDGLNVRKKCLNGARLLILGAAYKRGVGDLRESPALDVMKELIAKGANLVYADPFVQSLASEGLDLPRVTLTAALVRRQDAVVVLTDHREFDYRLVVDHADLVVDSRNATRGLNAPQGRIVRL
ncbi:MAG: nucleotide sugar dehydrogenase [Deltaproteobacteria bacterium]|nr:nucleotide sugar dehydrogenase [Deltaproteobacteria bacterium]